MIIVVVWIVRCTCLALESFAWMNRRLSTDNFTSFSVFVRVKPMYSQIETFRVRYIYGGGGVINHSLHLYTNCLNRIVQIL